MNSLKQISFVGFFSDVVLILVVVFLQNYPDLFTNNIAYFFATIAILQALALYAVMLNFDFNSPSLEKLPKIASSFMGLSLVLAAGGFLWMFLPAFAIDTPVMWTIATINIIIALFGGILGINMPKEHEGNPKLKIFHKTIGIFIPAIYLSISEILIFTSAQSEFVGTGVVILTVLISYFPIRFLMMLKPPFSILELISALSAFAYFVHTLVR